MKAILDSLKLPNSELSTDTVLRTKFKNTPISPKHSLYFVTPDNKKYVIGAMEGNSAYIYTANRHFIEDVPFPKLKKYLLNLKIGT